MSEIWLLIIGLTFATFAIRISGFLVGARLPSDGRWAAAFNALPGCLIMALVSVLLAPAGPQEWAAAAVAALVALVTRNLPLTMLAGIGAILTLRAYL